MIKRESIQMGGGIGTGRNRRRRNYNQSIFVFEKSPFFSVNKTARNYKNWAELSK